jgi:ABC-type dipeptide/oligopeptide/nickel transport system permease subunit
MSAHERGWRAFRRIRRAWYALLALGGVFLFCMAAEWTAPCDPNAVVDPATLEDSREPIIKHIYDVQTARFNRASDGTVSEFEGPDAVRALVTNAALPAAELRTRLEEKYRIRETPRQGYTRIFLEPLAAPSEQIVTLPPPSISFPFRPCKGHPFGIDAGGRDVYARVVHGMRIALLFGLLLAASGMFIGLVVGAIEGYFGGVLDITFQRLTEIWSAIPFLYVMIFIGSTLGRSFTVLLVCYAIFNWIVVSYYVRAEFLRLRTRTFVEAAKVQGLGAARIIFGQILPNALTPLITLFPFMLMGAIGSLAALDFLGFGLPPMTPSCGELMQEAQQFRSAWWLVVFPAAALFIVMLLAVLVGEGLRDAFDPRQKSKLE